MSSPCMVVPCTHDESMFHLAQCTTIRQHFWEKILNLMTNLGVKNNKSDAFLITGSLTHKLVVSQIGAEFLFLGWRTLYGEKVKPRVEQTT